eukprot:8419117-Alexandrium_andersonii.AAC.1
MACRCRANQVQLLACPALLVPGAKVLRPGWVGGIDNWEVRHVPARGPRRLSVHRQAIVGKLRFEGPLGDVVVPPGLSRA